MAGLDVIKAFQEVWITPYGLPYAFMSDQGRQYCSSEIRKFLKDNGIRQLFTNAYNPQGNGVSERLNQSIGLGCRINRHMKIKELENYIQKGMNSVYNRSLETCPSETFLGLNVLGPQKNKTEVDLTAVIERMRLQNQKTLDLENKKKTGKLKVGMSVYLSGYKPGKLEAKQEGPYKVIERSKNKTAVLLDLGFKKMWVTNRRICLIEEGVECGNITQSFHNEGTMAY